ncbi:MAG TPA: alpha-hydroxy-acid oxidizing protein [Nakamurella sp.]|nr:alpha-hydroxy-acid oxidizing protein [Nakamurella sp.]
MAGLGDVQNSIYLGGLAGRRQPVPIAPAALREAARAALNPEAFDYLDGGAGAERTMAGNLAAFDRYRIVPRMLSGRAERDLATTVAGQQLPVPVLAAPIGVLDIVHPDAELAVARACAALGVTMVLSTQSSTPLEAVAEIGGPRWYQLYWPNVPELADSLVHRAEAAGYSALVVTLDTPLLGWRPRDLDRPYLPFLAGHGIANYTSDPVFRSLLPVTGSPAEAAMAAVQTFVRVFGTLALTFDQLTQLCAATRLPVLVKGVLHPDDALAAADSGAAGVIVSNHGGRQVDRARPALESLPDVVAAVGDGCDVLFDSGIRSGADIAIALALGAKAVLVGRPYAYGLAVAGQDGAAAVLAHLLGELDITLALAGCCRPSDLVVTPG